MYKYILIHYLLHHATLSASTTANPTGRGRTARQADTNVIAVKFNTLTEPSHMHTGDAVVCNNKECTAILSHLSKLKQNIETGAKVSQRQVSQRQVCHE